MDPCQFSMIFSHLMSFDGALKRADFQLNIAAFLCQRTGATGLSVQPHVVEAATPGAAEIRVC